MKDGGLEMCTFVIRLKENRAVDQGKPKMWKLKCLQVFPEEIGGTGEGAYSKRRDWRR